MAKKEKGIEIKFKDGDLWLTQKYMSIIIYQFNFIHEKY